MGLLGSAALKELWDKQGYPYHEAVIINLDCISRGRQPLIVYHREARLAHKVKACLANYLSEPKMVDMHIVPLSDNYVFRKQGAITISSVEPSLLPGGYYIPKIHVPEDQDFDSGKVYAWVAGLAEFVQQELSRSGEIQAR
jgi:hypothetical protein